MIVLLKLSGRTLKDLRACTKQSHWGQTLVLISVGGRWKRRVTFQLAAGFHSLCSKFPLVFPTPPLAFPVCDFFEKEYLSLIIPLLCCRWCSMDSTGVWKDVNRYSGKEWVTVKPYHFGHATCWVPVPLGPSHPHCCSELFTGNALTE